MGHPTRHIALNIEEATEDNQNFRDIIYTDEFMQLVLMSVKPGEEIGLEKHKGAQFIRIESGTGVAIIEGIEYPVLPGDAYQISPNTWHNFINTGDEDLKLYTLYAPPEH